ncbi:hypothetical protein PILCRDRAFT_829133 [Piloderma croceum F 1598]|uniref:Peptidase A1 domain-containing protein n=1 Tax=Piloderma croceum (strain F 1598) TaxID=765440 RepID=A0A0C3F0F5_PILCF|nr:hypothetical protein PILCRDRAFT_829133 [Piloderma croceum F 1598]
MFPTKSLLSLLFIAVSLASDVTAIPTPRDSKATLTFARRFNISVGDGFPNIADADRARAKNFQSLGPANKGGQNKRAASILATNQAASYTVDVGIGTPPTKYTLLIDTGSSNTWVGAGKAYVPTRSSKDTGEKVTVSYGSGSFSGEEFTDTVTLSPHLVIAKQSIGVASTSKGFQNVDGIIGIGPVDLTIGTLSPSTSQTIPTVTDNLFSKGAIREHLVSVAYAPTIAEGVQNGELTFGGIDLTRFVGEITFVPITQTSPASNFWGIDQSITYGSTPILSSTAGIVDTGTTLTLIASDAFATYQKATGGVPDSATGLLKITSAQYSALRDLHFKVGPRTFSLTPNAQIWPRALNTFIGGTADSIYLIVADIGTPSGQGLDFINGYTFLERFYSVYDTANKRVGLAATCQTDAWTN